MLWLVNVSVGMIIAQVLHLFHRHCWFPGGSLGGGVLISAWTRMSSRFVGLLYVIMRTEGMVVFIQSEDAHIGWRA